MSVNGAASSVRRWFADIAPERATVKQDLVARAGHAALIRVRHSQPSFD